MSQIRVRALRAIAGLQRDDVAEVDDTPYIRSAIEAGHLERLEDRNGGGGNNGGRNGNNNGGNGGARRGPERVDEPPEQLGG